MNKLRRNLFPSLLLGLPLSGMTTPAKSRHEAATAQGTDRRALKADFWGGAFRAERKSA